MVHRCYQTTVLHTDTFMASTDGATMSCADQARLGLVVLFTAAVLLWRFAPPPVVQTLESSIAGSAATTVSSVEVCELIPVIRDADIDGQRREARKAGGFRQILSVTHTRDEYALFSRTCTVMTGRGQARS